MTSGSNVSEAVGATGAEIVATDILPTAVSEKPIVALGFPGGGYSPGYWDIHWPGGYSEAEYHASRGWVSVAVDQLGVGDSSLLDPSMLTFEVLAAANSAATERIVSMLCSGAFAANSPAPFQNPRLIGVGRSMGGCVSIVSQATRQPFDALAILGLQRFSHCARKPAGWNSCDPNCPRADRRRRVCGYVPPT